MAAWKEKDSVGGGVSAGRYHNTGIGTRMGSLRVRMTDSLRKHSSPSCVSLIILFLSHTLLATNQDLSMYLLLTIGKTIGNSCILEGVMLGERIWAVGSWGRQSKDLCEKTSRA